MPFNTGTIVKSQLAKPCVGAEELITGSITNSHLTNGCVAFWNIINEHVITEKIGNSQITQAKLASSSVGTSQLKTSLGSWSISVPPSGGISSVNLVNFSFFPRQRTQYSNHFIWHSWIGNFSNEEYRIFSRNSEEISSNWNGSYYYVTASEQIVEVYRDISTNRVIGAHVTEKGNENSVHYFNNNKIEILVKREIYNYLNTPNLFEQKVCKLTATKIMDNLLEEKAIDERN